MTTARTEWSIPARPSAAAAIRRRRQCLSCGRRFTTFERIDEVGVMVVKRDGWREPYAREKVLAGVRKAIVNRPVTEEQVDVLADRVEERLRRKGPQVSSHQVGVEVLSQLQKLDQVVHMRLTSYLGAGGSGPDPTSQHVFGPSA